MNLMGKFVLLSAEKKTSKKTGKEYNQALLQQGTEFISVLSNDEKVHTLQKYKEYPCVLNYSPKFSDIKLEVIGE